MSKQPIEDRLKEHRYRRGWNQLQLGLATGLSLATIKRAEAGVPLRAATLYRLEQFLKKEATAA